MKPVLERLSEQSQRLGRSINRDRVTRYLEAGHRAEAFADTLNGYERDRVAEVRALLLDDQFTRTIQSGRLTFAMVRPHQELGRNPGPDAVIANQIVSQIEKRGRFKTALNLPWPVSPEAFREFYGHVEDKLRGIEKTAPDGTPSNVWELFEKYGTTGATSFLVLDGKQLQEEYGHQAWQLWRGFIGATNPLQALPGTLRREFGSDYNNVVHGSDSLAAVHSDIQWMARQLRTREL